MFVQTRITHFTFRDFIRKHHYFQLEQLASCIAKCVRKVKEYHGSIAGKSTPILLHLVQNPKRREPQSNFKQTFHTIMTTATFAILFHTPIQIFNITYYYGLKKQRLEFSRAKHYANHFVAEIYRFFQLHRQIPLFH